VVIRLTLIASTHVNIVEDNINDVDELNNSS